MKTWVRKSLNVGVLSAGFLLVSGGAAHAADVTGDNAGILNGNQIDNTVQVPVDVSGNAISLFGFADAGSVGGAWATEGGSATESWTTGHNAGVLNGNQLSNTLQAPISVCGNAIAVLGFADAGCEGGAGASHGGGSAHGAGEAGAAASNGGGSHTTGWNAGVGNGNQVSNVIQAPIDLSGNAISVLGFASAGSTGGAWANNGGTESSTTGFNAGVANGNQVSNVIQVPVSVCGNAVAVLGFASAGCTGGSWANNGGGNGGNVGGGNGGNGGGNGGGYNGGGSGNGGYGNGTGSGSGGGYTGGGSGSGSDDCDDNGSGSGSGGYGGGTGTGTGTGTGSGNGGYGAGTGTGTGYTGTGTGSGSGNDYTGTGAAAGHTTKHVTKAVKQVTKVAGEAAKAHGVKSASATTKHHSNSGSGMSNGGGSGASNGGGSGASAGSASDWTTGYNAGVLNGNQLSNVIQLPIDISGNAVGILGFASAGSTGGSWANA